MGSKFQAQMVGRRIIVWSIQQGIELYSSGFYGKPIGVRKPQLGDEFRDPSEISPFEAMYLLDQKLISIKDEKDNSLTKKILQEKCTDHFLNFESKMRVYRHLRDLGYIVRPGLKFGVDFAVYIKGPGLEHSPYMVQIIEKNGKIDPIELVRAGRLATTVRKNFVLASTIKNKLHFFIFGRFKP
ncbi:MAG: tRNA-intron lyase [Candidatus Heimdallarchaeaceae archaeon]